ncbi:MAG TPA: hypothetical protein DIT28_04655 [Oxalobacteraceae bacterium]|jgi:hypothetical protein|nr:hypothetical protein [Oxalobacteraceae bacterium]HCN88454.1 hypothetical protein [Oxalobacteraceae bacterium]
MKTFLRYLRISSLALTCAIGLAACGGYSALTLGGTVSGLTNSGLVLANGGDTVSVPANVTSYAFPNQINVGASFHVTIQSQPQHMTCAVIDISGTAGTTSTTNINVACAQNSYAVGGTVSGLTAGGLVLINGADVVTIAANATVFTMPAKVPDGSVYGIAVLTQPTGLTCSVVNGTAYMAEAAVTGVQVICVPV